MNEPLNPSVHVIVWNVMGGENISSFVHFSLTEIVSGDGGRVM